MTTLGKLINPVSPALPVGPVDYSRQYQDQLNNVLRLYFRQLDGAFSGLLGGNGGRFLELPHIAAQDSTSQYTTTNTATKVLWNQLDSGSGFTLNPDSTATAEFTGVYKIDYSLQFANTDSQIHDAFVWLQVNGDQVAGSASKFTVPNKHGSVNGYLVAYSSVTFEITAGQPISLYWATNQARVISPAADGIFMEAIGAQTSPFAMPAIPSAIGSIVFVSRLST